MKNISVIGLGLMGTPISDLLMKAGYRVTGYDVVRRQMSNLVPLGLRAVNSPAEAARGADLIIEVPITMVEAALGATVRVPRITLVTAGWRNAQAMASRAALVPRSAASLASSSPRRLFCSLQ